MDFQADPHQAADDVYATYVNQYLVVSALALLYWDYFLTLSDEIKLYWGKQHKFFKSSVSILFFLNRYVALFAHVPVAFEFFVKAPQHLYVAAATLTITFLAAIRTYALYHRKRAMLVFLVTFMTTALSVAFWAIFTGNKTPPIFGHAYTLGYCDLSISVDENSEANVGSLAPLTPSLTSTSDNPDSAIAWSAVLAFDAAIFALTLFRRIRVGAMPENGLFTLMVHDGTIYFGIIVVLYLIDLVTLLVPVSSPIFRGYVVVYTNVFSIVMMNRMMLNIWKTHHDDGHRSTVVQVSTVVYAKSTVPAELDTIVDTVELQTV
ncbi:hypothetical protein EIP91_009951 [Steccherinum ochraceum]|uniref:DUF6533 domain-containing protein n=1 Tax=Steccherinum ochraceum TaxID=92696 RepID=A0A4R0R6G6_9APHY|nr:hypothetical protein EIP91_009951 [Steccherinum ochraceum]